MRMNGIVMIIDKIGPRGRCWYSAAHVSELQYMLGYLRTVYDYIKDVPAYRPVKQVIALRDLDFDQVSKVFPRLETFRNKYGLHKRILCLEYSSRQDYLHLPHDHDDIESSIFFPVHYSDHAGTAFFEPTSDQIIEVPQLKLGRELGDTLTKPRYSCLIDTIPVEVAGGNRPMIFKTDILHSAYEIEIGHPDNYARITIAWESPKSFQMMIDSLSHE